MEPQGSQEISRRAFLKILSATGAGLLLEITLGGCRETDTPYPTSDSRRTLTPGETPEATSEVTSEALLNENSFAPNIYLEINSKGEVTVTAFRSEMGQGVRTAIAMILAEELDAPWEAVRVIRQAQADPDYGDQVTGGSASVAESFAGLRYAGAGARRILVNAAAKTWDVEPDQCTTQPGQVIHPDGATRLGYGDIVAANRNLEAPPGLRADLKDESTFFLLGTNKGHWDAETIVTGKAIYGLDVRLPGMLFAVLARCPVFGGKLVSFDATQALQVPGVKHLEPVRQAVAVVAENSWAALRGREMLQVTWDEGKNAGLNSGVIREGLGKGFPDPANAKSGTLAGIYDIPFEAHNTMEPMNCTAHLHDEICEVWAPTQNPQAVQTAVAGAIGLPSSSVIINVTLLGGGFGRRLQTDYAVEAALVSQAIGAPVQVFWTRQDDIQHDFYHPMSRHYASVELDAIKLLRINSQESHDIPTGPWRSVGNFPAAYVHECFVDEIAHALGRDPVEIRLELNDQRSQAVIKLAAEKSGWGEPLPPGWGRGIAYHATFGVTPVAMVAEVEVPESGLVRVHRVVCAVDCGTVVNPGNVEAQMQGGIAFGLTAALKARITLSNGRVEQANFDDCPILLMGEMPEVEVYFVDSDRSPSGIGEMGVPPIAPAVANAVFAATGKRIRQIPILSLVE